VPVWPEPGSYELPPIDRVGEHWLLDSKGAPAPLLGLARGEATVIAFVYRHCPAACPAALSVLQQVDREIARDDDLRASVRLVAVSFDPSRDRPEAMAEWRERFAPASDWRFLTAAGDAEITPVLADFDQSAIRLVMGDDGVPTLLWRHVLKVFLVDDSGQVRNVYSSGILSPEPVLADLRTLRLEARVETAAGGARGPTTFGSR
jgi:cytochrome oxidase Cu insertion factor (SCO1/SenC/PrrC family)